MTKLTLEEDLAEEALLKENTYNWKEAAKLYAQVADAFLDEESFEKAAKYYKKLGYAYAKASHTVDTPEDFKNVSNMANNAYKNALNLFNQIEKTPENLECEAEIFKIKGLFANSKVEGKEYYKKSYELFVKSSEIYRNVDNQKSTIRILSNAIESIFHLILCCTEQEEIENFIQKGVKISQEAWVIANKVNNYDLLAESLSFLGHLNFLYAFVMPIKRDVDFKEHLNDCLSREDIIVKLIQEGSAPNLIAVDNFFAGSSYAGFAIQFVEDAIKQKEYGDKGITLMEVGLKNIKKFKDKRSIITGIFFLNYLATSLRRFDYVQKRIWQDMHTLLEMGKIYENALIEPYFFRTILPAFYYNNLAQRSFIKPDQQKKYAELAIQYAKESLE
ncbi:MAG: hypothetical protein ACFFAV_09380, partial [Candidatus Hermodarchaeota archaeon]